ncbi:MAG TPA: LutB/LldF family L-lactate oxidation iron-sulfur protein [Arachnia sp.]|nr:LutB/LldF family L-lactate oxidation iron-sulfur protein [Arachnia sp.]HMT86374.1 LutB/LldF family L-lactate oxidation iron-sulfur protein [Arachnia sp.]
MSVDEVRGARLTPAPPSGTYLGMPAFPQAAKDALHDHQMRQNLRYATTAIREKRALRAAEVSDWEDLRTAGEQIKNKVARHLDSYLLQAEEAMTAAGITVHWARDAAEANRIVIDIARAKQADEVVKIKSMVTQEIELNEALEEAGIAAWETDLAELIVQFGHDRPSHILVPAIHRNRAEVREIFVEEMGLWGKPAPEGLSDEPSALAAAARSHLREKFLRAKVAVSGGNFIVAETGTLVIVESEGNGRMCLTLPETLISVVGIEKLVPTFDDLEVFLRLLPRSSTAERMNPYTSMWTGVTEGDGPQDLHVILLDNGRTNVLADPVGRQALRCIRCSACMNVCPVYERVGGHTYGSVYPGPIGAILTPQLRGLSSPVDTSLPFASSLCGACDEVCPVKIPISDILVHLRAKVVEKKTKRHPTVESLVFGAVGWALGTGSHLEFVEGFSETAGRVFTRRTHFGVLPFPVASSWAEARDLPVPAKQTFRDWWAHREATDETGDRK